MNKKNIKSYFNNVTNVFKFPQNELYFFFVFFTWIWLFLVYEYIV